MTAWKLISFDGKTGQTEESAAWTNKTVRTEE